MNILHNLLVEFYVVHFMFVVLSLLHLFTQCHFLYLSIIISHDRGSLSSE